MKQLTIATVEGYWSTNIGNALFQISAFEIFSELGYNVIKVPDLPGYINPSKGNPKDYFEIMDYIECDYFCVHGPFFRIESDKILIPLLKRLNARGVKIIGLGVGAMHYDAKALQYYKEWVNEIDFHLISTRDEVAYLFLKDFLPKKTLLLNGLDLGFFISRFRPQPKLIDNKEIVCFNFDQIPEPYFNEDPKGVISVNDNNFSCRKSFSSEPKGILKKILPYYLPFIKKFNRRELGGYKVVRTDHRFNPYFGKKIYSNPNSFGMDTPAGYLLLYANSKLTLSNRVHANVATLSYGNKAMYFSNSKRAKLLDRVNLGDIYNKPMMLNQTIIDDELEILKDFLRLNL